MSEEKRKKDKQEEADKETKASELETSEDLFSDDDDLFSVDSESKDETEDLPRRN